MEQAPAGSSQPSETVPGYWSEAPRLAAELRAIHTAEDAPSVLLEAARVAARFSSAAVTVLLADHARGELVPWTTGETARREPRDTTVPLTAALQEALLQTPGLRSCSEDDGPEALASLLQIRSDPALSLTVVPLVQNGRLIGAFALEFPGPLPLRALDQELALLAEHTAIALRRMSALDDLHRRTEDLSALVALDQALSRAPDFEQMLGQIIEYIKQLVGAEMCSFRFYDPATDELVYRKPSFGLTQEMIAKTRLPIKGGGVAVEVFLTGRPRMSNDVPNDPHYLHLVTNLLGIHNSMIVPLEVSGKRIGTYTVANKREGEFTDNELRLATLLSSHLGLLLENARLLENEVQTVAKLQEMNQIVEEQRQVLERTLAIHDQFTRIVLLGHGLEATCAELGRLLATHVALEDQFGTLLTCYSLPGPTRQDDAWCQTVAAGGTLQALKDEPEVAGPLSRLRSEGRPVEAVSLATELPILGAGRQPFWPLRSGSTLESSYRRASSGNLASGPLLSATFCEHVQLLRLLRAWLCPAETAGPIAVDAARLAKGSLD